MATIDEKELEDFLMEPGNLQHLEIYEHESTFTKRQWNLGGYGIADIVSVTSEPYDLNERHYLITVLELKKDEVNVATLQQACRYVAGLKQLIKRIPAMKGLYYQFQIVLVGGSLNINDWVYIGHHLENVRVWTYSLSLDSGVEFKEESLSSYQITNPGFPKDATSIFEELIEPRRLKTEEEYVAYLERVESEKARSLPKPEAKALPEKTTESVWVEANG